MNLDKLIQTISTEEGDIETYQGIVSSLKQMKYSDSDISFILTLTSTIAAQQRDQRGINEC